MKRRERIFLINKLFNKLINPFSPLNRFENKNTKATRGLPDEKNHK